MSGAEVVRAGIAGLLTQLVSAPTAVLVDALSYLVSAGSIARIRTSEPSPAGRTHAQNLRQSISDGLRTVAMDSVLRALAAEAALYNLFYTAVLDSADPVRNPRSRVEPRAAGAVLALGAVGSVIGAIMVERHERRWTIGRVMLRSYAVACLAPLLIQLAAGPPLVAAGMLAAAFLIMGFSTAVIQVYVWSLRQSMVAPEALGRMNAAYRFVVSGTVPGGALLGGVLGTTFGLRIGIAIGACAIVLAVLPILFSPIPALRTLPMAAAE